MPIDPVTGSLILGGANAILGGLQNKKNRNWAEERYGVERKDAITDWHRQNTYNSPVEWRKRQEAAGINPFYTGQSSGGGSASPVASKSTQSAQGKAPQLSDYIGAQKLGLETKLINAQTEKIKAETNAINYDYDGSNEGGKVWSAVFDRLLNEERMLYDKSRSQATTENLKMNKEVLDEQLKDWKKANRLPEGIFRSDGVMDRQIGPVINKILTSTNSGILSKGIAALAAILFKKKVN